MRLLFSLFVTLGFFLSVLYLTSEKIGQPFPGYLTFKNRVVGAFYLPEWSGAKEGIHYHDILPSPPVRGKRSEFFTKRDFFLVVVLPAVSGLLFLLLGIGVSLLLPSDSGRLPFFFFHLLVGLYLILSPDFQLTYYYAYLHLVVFALIAAPMVHFALVFPEPSKYLRHKFVKSLPYLVSGLLAVPYLFFFMRNPPLWIRFEYVIVAYVVIGYLFWIARLLKMLRRPQLDIHRIIVRYLLLGQVVGFMIPCVAVIVVFLGGVSLPLNLVTPFTLLFPISLFVGIVMGRLQQDRMELVQVEKRAALGNMYAALTHELNNPMTFIYSSIEPLKELLKEKERSKDVSELVDLIEEGAERAKGIIDNFRFFSARENEMKERMDINEVIEKSLKLLTPKWKDRIKIEKQYGPIPTIDGFPHELGQVFVNLLGNACEAIQEKGTICIETSLENEESIKISFRDTGSGIPKEIRDRIFDPFFRTKAQGEGTGLGLAISLEIVKKHGGKIEVKSEMGRGTEFVITLPL